MFDPTSGQSNANLRGRDLRLDPQTTLLYPSDILGSPSIKDVFRGNSALSKDNACEYFKLAATDTESCRAIVTLLTILIRLTCRVRMLFLNVKLELVPSVKQKQMIPSSFVEYMLRSQNHPGDEHILP